MSTPATPDDDVADPGADDPIAAERDHLDRSRAALARMRARTSALDTSAAGDWVSQQILESAIYRRMKALEDDPTVPLFFGRLDYDEAHEDARGERFYIGRRHVTDESGDPMVVDWRARISGPFYRASKADPLGVRLRRRFGFQQGAMTAFEDERLLDGVEEAHSEILEAEIERPRVGPMRDIVATIQPEQDLIVRSDLARSVCVQGAPGTGKTAVGLHRAAYLLYAHRDQLSRQGVLVVGPNASFLRYIGDVLPALGEIDAQQTTIEEMVGKTLAGPTRATRSGARTRRRSRPSRATPAWRPCCTGRCGPTSRPRTRDWSCRAARAGGGWRRTRPRRSSRRCASAGSATARLAACSSSGSRTPSW